MQGAGLFFVFLRAVCPVKEKMLSGILRFPNIRSKKLKNSFQKQKNEL